jgi:DNA-binding FadR family transcriptional regulator
MLSERTLSEQVAVARSSVRAAMQGLWSLGVIERRGNRSYVRERLPEIRTMQSGRAHRVEIAELAPRPTKWRLPGSSTARRATTR